MKTSYIRIICLAAILPMAIQAANKDIQKLAQQAGISLSRTEQQCLNTNDQQAMDPQAIKSCVNKSLPNIIAKAKKAAQDSGKDASQAKKEIHKKLNQSSKSAEEISEIANKANEQLKACENNNCDISNLETQLSNAQGKITKLAKQIINGDITHETMELAIYQIIQQAATAMLAKANSSTQTALALLN